MGMKLDGQDFKVKLTAEPIGGEGGKRSFIGQTQEEKNIIIVDGTLEPSRQEEVLLHELLHLCDMGMPEFMVANMSTRLHGFLSNNSLLRSGIVEKVSDGVLDKDEMAKVNEMSNAVAENVEAMGGMMPSNYAVSEEPWHGDAGAYV